MSKKLSGWQQFLRLLRSQLKDRDWKKISRWLVITIAIVSLWCWNWQIFLAIAVGIALMAASFSVQNRNWQKHWQKWQRFLLGSNGRLAIAAFSGGMGGFSTYLAANIWTDSENPWLATGSILEGFGSLLTLGVLGWYVWQNNRHSTEIRIEKLLLDLSDREPVKRLVAIRQLTRLVGRDRLASDYYGEVVECYRLLLSQPQPPAIRKALLEGLQDLGIPQISPAKPPRRMVKIPLKLEHSPKTLSIESDR